MNVDLNHLRIEDRPAGTSRRRLPVLLLALLLLPAGFALGWFLRGGAGGAGPNGLPLRIEAVRVEGRGGATAPAGDGFTEGGWIEVPSYHPIVVSALIPGRVEELLVLEGARVEADQVVARLYAKDLDDSLRLAESQAAAARAELDLLTAGYREEDVERARHELERLEREVELAKRVAERTASLVPTGAASVEELDRDETAVRTAAAARDGAAAELQKLERGYRKEEVERAKAELARAEAARDLAKSRRSYAEVRSPAAGVVLERFVTPGTTLFEGDRRVVSLYDPEDLQARVDVRQENAGRIRVGQDVELSTEAEPGRTYRGTVIRIEPLANLKKNTVQAKIRIEEPGTGLHPEMICRARFKEARPEEPEPSGAKRVLTVPSRAVRAEGSRRYLFVVRDGRAVRTEVRTGEERGDRVVIEAGVFEGDRVVVDPPADLTDGAERSEGGNR